MRNNRNQDVLIEISLGFMWISIALILKYVFGLHIGFFTMMLPAIIRYIIEVILFVVGIAYYISHKLGGEYED